MSDKKGKAKGKPEEKKETKDAKGGKDAKGKDAKDTKGGKDDKKDAKGKDTKDAKDAKGKDTKGGKDDKKDTKGDKKDGKGKDDKKEKKDEKDESKDEKKEKKPTQVVPQKKRIFRKFQYRGIDLENLFEIGPKELRELFPARARRRFSRGLTNRSRYFIKKLRKVKREAPTGDKPEPVKTHLRNTIIVPEMIGSVVGIHNGHGFNNVEIRAEMIGHYLGEFAITYKPVKHGKPGIGATHSSRFIPLK